METMYPTYSQEATNAMLSKFLKKKKGNQIQNHYKLPDNKQLMVSTSQIIIKFSNLFWPFWAAMDYFSNLHLISKPLSHIILDKISYLWKLFGSYYLMTEIIMPSET